MSTLLDISTVNDMPTILDNSTAENDISTILDMSTAENAMSTIWIRRLKLYVHRNDTPTIWGLSLENDMSIENDGHRIWYVDKKISRQY